MLTHCLLYKPTWLSNAHTVALKVRKRKAQDKNDIAEEARLCNAIGAEYTKKGTYSPNKPFNREMPPHPGSYKQALHYHLTELQLSESTGDTLDTAISHRRVGECLSELRDYEQAIKHTRQYLKMAQEMGLLHIMYKCPSPIAVNT